MDIVPKLGLGFDKSSLKNSEYLEVKFKDTINLSRFVLYAGGLFMASFWAWDWVIDPAGAQNTIVLRLICLMFVLFPIATKYMSNRIWIAAISYLAITFAVGLLYFILGRLSIGHLKGIVGFVGVLTSTLIIGFPFSFKHNIIGYCVAVLFPVIMAIFFPVNYDRFVIEYIAFLVPYSFVILLFHFLLDKLYSEIYISRKKIITMANTDSLTGLYNRRNFRLVCDKVIAISKRRNYDISVMYLDLDYFKSVNDRFGHNIGDIVLTSLSKNLINICRKSDIIGRLGGEEFALCLPETDLSGALLLAERIRKSFANQVYYSEDGKHEFSVTLSIGVISCNGESDDLVLDDMLNKADSALYTAKKSGRDRVACFE